MWLDLAIAMSCAGAGLVCGWIMHAIGVLGIQQGGRQEIAPAGGQPGEVERIRQQISEVGQRLQTYALSMAADVDAHQTKMQAVNHTLSQEHSQGQETSHDAVIRAIGDLIAANEEMQVQLKQAQDRIHEQTMQIESAERRAQTDALTRVPNRRAFDEHIEARVALEPTQAGTLALLDVDHFKKFNDVYGHRAGDEVLRIVAHILHSRLQAYGLVARFGGEEFAIILDGIPVEHAKILVERARIAIGEREMRFEDKRLRVSASIGLAQYEPGQTIANWIQQADEALYRSKGTGRDCGHWMNGVTPVRIEIGDTTASSSFPGSSIPGSSIPGSGEQVFENREDVAGALVDDDTLPELACNSITGLPDTGALESLYDQMRLRTRSRIPIVLMAIRCHGEVAETTIRSLVQVARSTMRGVDRIGSMGHDTLLICMPSVDEEMAIQRGRQICRSAQAIGLKWKGIGPRPVSIGIVQANASETFSAIVSRAIEFADQARDACLDPICIAQSEAAVSGS